MLDQIITLKIFSHGKHRLGAAKIRPGKTVKSFGRTVYPKVLKNICSHAQKYIHNMK